MLFEVEISTTITKKVLVEAEDLSSAAKTAQSLNEQGFYDAHPQVVTGRSYNAYLTCPRCGKKVRLYYEDEGCAICLPCYKELVRKYTQPAICAAF